MIQDKEEAGEQGARALFASERAEAVLEHGFCG